MITIRGAGIGLAIAPGRVVARSLGAQGPDRLSWQHELGAGTPAPAGTDRWREQLTDALRSLRPAAPRARTLHVALLPPLAEMRLAVLPAIHTTELRLALERDASKYFPTGLERQVVTVRRAGAITAGFAPHLVAWASERIVADVLAAAAAAGWRVRSLAPASLAWAQAASERRGAAGGSHAVLLRYAEREDVLDVRDGAIVGIRRRRAPAEPPDTAGPRALANSLDEALHAAAQCAVRSDEQSFWPVAVREARARADWRTAGRLAAAAATLVVLASGIAWVAAAGDLARIAGERRVLRPRVAAAMTARDSLAALGRQLAILRGFGTIAPRWSSVIVALGNVLPADASLIALRTNGDTLILTGEAEHAATVFSALARSGALAGVRAEAPIQQQVENGEVVAERFTIAARLSPPRPR